MTKIQWPKEIFQRYAVVASPSQLVDAADCERKWWFRSVVRLPELEGQEKFDFGTTLHAVVERWLKADETGRGEDGKPVDLYPPGWDNLVNNAQAAAIKVLVEKAIEVGMLRRTAGRKIEDPFVREVTPEAAIIGVIDVDYPAGCEDHKTTGDFKWVLTPKQLASDLKMLCYAYERIQRWRAAGVDPLPEKVTLRLNYFHKNPDRPQVRHVEVDVMTQDVLAFWEGTVVRLARRMVELKRSEVPAERWREIPGPTSKDACRKYGGCPRAPICGYTESVEAHRVRINRANGAVVSSSPPQQPKGDPTMSVLKRALDRKAAAQAAVPSAPVPPSAPPAVTPAAPVNAATAAPAATQAADVPPWTVKDCRGCEGKGINSAGEPCRACKTVQERRGGVSPAHFKVWRDGSTLRWEPLAGAPAPTAGVAPLAAEAKASPAQVVRPTEAPKAPEPPPAPAAPEAPAKTKAPRAKKTEAAPTTQPQVVLEPTGAGFTLYINCVPLDEDFLDLSELLLTEQRALAAAEKVGSFYDLDAFQRRDTLASHAQEVAEELHGKNVVALGGSADFKAYLDVLRPLAARVVVGTF